MNAKLRRLAAFAALALTFSACGPTRSPTPPEVSNLAEESVQSTKPPSKDVALLNASGPWLVFSDTAGIWAMNADGSGLTRVVERNYSDPPIGVTLSPAPSGGVVAILEYNSGFFALPELGLLSLPDAGWSPLTPLVAPEIREAMRDPERQEAAYDAAHTAGSDNAPAWSPDGRQLAFSGAMDGPTSDLYVFNRFGGDIRRLTDGPTQSVQPIAWSPDGLTIVQGGATRTGFDRAGWGDDLDAIWAVRADGSKVTQLYPLSITGEAYVLGWLSDTEFLSDQLEFACSRGGLRAVDIATGEITDLWEGRYDGSAYDPVSRMLLFSVVEEESARFPRFYDECAPFGEPGMYLMPVDGGSPRFLSGQGRIVGNQVFWSPEAGRFYLYGDSDLILVSPEGEVARYPAPQLKAYAPIAVAPDGGRWAMVATDGSLWLGSVDGDLREIFSGTASSPTWTPDGDSLFFFDGEDSMALYMASFDPSSLVQIGDGFLQPEAYARPTTLTWVVP